MSEGGGDLVPLSLRPLVARVWQHRAQNLIGSAGGFLFLLDSAVISLGVNVTITLLIGPRNIHQQLLMMLSII